MDLYKVIIHLFVLFFTIERKSGALAQAEEPFTLNEYLSGTFSTRSFNGVWLTEDSFIYRNSAADTLLFDLKSKNSTVFLPTSVFAAYPGASTTVSADQSYVLIRYNVSAVFRHSTTAVYTIYDIANNQYYDIEDKNHIQNAQWAPQGHGLIYVYLNNIYYLEQASAAPKVLTIDGVPGVIYNGVPDWVYEEEVLGSGSAVWFSPSGTHIAFVKFDDTEVEEFDYFIYGNPGDLNDQYPTEVKIRYPKVGRTNPHIQIFVANLVSGAELPLLSELKVIPEKMRIDQDYIVYDIVWVTDEEMIVLYSNRVQNQAQLVRCNSAAVCDIEPEATYQEENGWLEPQIPQYSKDGTKKIEILPQPQGNDQFDHLVLTDVATTTARRLTQGPFYVLAVYGWDEPNNLIYFAGTGDNEPSQQQVYVVNTETIETRCLTCDMNTSRGLCKYGGASFSKDFSYVAKICQGPGPYLVEIQNLRDESDVLLWEDNQALIDRLSVKAQPVIKNLQVPLPDGFQANVRLLLPPGLDESGTRKYPAVVYVYAGPNYNQISDAYSSGFQNYVVTNREYIYILIDGRGSGKDGQNKMFQVYRRLATVEIQDQIAVTKYLQETLPYIDASNTGIWGWSYGGFATAWVLVQDTENVFKFGLSVAPVTSFIYYDSIYTERYMGLPVPEDNLGGYNGTDVTRNVEALRGKLFFLIHGNADDNVHYQQSMLLSKALEEADIPFTQQSYPDENHSLGGVSPHLYHAIDRFWARSFGLPDPPAPRLTPEDKVNE